MVTEQIFGRSCVGPRSSQLAMVLGYKCECRPCLLLLLLHPQHHNKPVLDRKHWYNIKTYLKHFFCKLHPLPQHQSFCTKNTVSNEHHWTSQLTNHYQQKSTMARKGIAVLKNQQIKARQTKRLREYKFPVPDKPIVADDEVAVYEEFKNRWCVRKKPTARQLELRALPSSEERIGFANVAPLAEKQVSPPPSPPEEYLPVSDSEGLDKENRSPASSSHTSWSNRGHATAAYTIRRKSAPTTLFHQRPPVTSNIMSTEPRNIGIAPLACVSKARVTKIKPVRIKAKTNGRWHTEVVGRPSALWSVKDL